MKEVIALAKKEIVEIQKAIAGLEQEIAVKKHVLSKLAALLEVAGESLPKKRGRKPKGYKAVAQKPVKKGPRRGRKAAGEPTLPQLIVEVLKKSGAALNAKEVLAGLQKKGWETGSGDPQAMVYKTLHRIAKEGMIVKAERGRFVPAA